MTGVLSLHVFAAALSPAIGLAQLSPRLRHHWPRTHRWLGRFHLGAWLAWVPNLVVGECVVRRHRLHAASRVRATVALPLVCDQSGQQ